MSAQHTPGPWRWNDQWLNNGSEQILWYTTDDDGIHCLPEHARLIAAAPDLLAALEDIANLRPSGDVSTCKQPRILVEVMEIIALNAIEKATGKWRNVK